MSIKTEKLFHENGKQAAAGDDLTDFRGTKYKLVEIIPPHKQGSSGRVVARALEGYQVAFYPSVFNLRWCEVEEC
jgi:hypothetical protein